VGRLRFHGQQRADFARRRSSHHRRPKRIHHYISSSPGQVNAQLPSNISTGGIRTPSADVLEDLSQLATEEKLSKLEDVFETALERRCKAALVQLLNENMHGLTL
jgi:hypothetical protein